MYDRSVWLREQATGNTNQNQDFFYVQDVNSIGEKRT